LNEKIQKSTTLKEIYKSYPAKSQLIATELANIGLSCSSCCCDTTQSLEAILSGLGLKNEQLDAVILQLNEILSQETEDMISLTEQAAKQFLTLMTQDNKTGWALRFGIQGGGCCGFEYFLDAAPKAEESDTVFESNGVKILIDPNSLPYLMGTVIDYVDGENGPGFKIINPSAGCGCNHGCC
jgi:iron-sulfur cluster assembly protein